ncbi:hypothetical protein ACJIZ3_002210 [Penstemon smallii]|uniref:Uncharacterized protein n=1 Tax=Penstemon smallii TaxID=265156 RepID=A0ABD3U909_9LAMI
MNQKRRLLARQNCLRHSTRCCIDENILNRDRRFFDLDSSD